MISTYHKEYKVLLAVDCIIFGFDENRLKVLLIKRGFEPEKGKWSLMGGFLKEDDTLDTAAQRVLYDLTALSNLYLEQLFTFSEVNRDPEERTISVAYYALLNMAEMQQQLSSEYSAKWFDIDELPQLIFDHEEMVHKAIERLKYRSATEPVTFELLPKKFTMRQLQLLYEQIYGQGLDKGNFTKKINALNILKKLDEKDMTSSKKGSYLFQFDQEKYNHKIAKGFSFKV